MEYEFPQDLVGDVEPSTSVTKSKKPDFTGESLGGFYTLPYQVVLVTYGFGEGRFGEDYFGVGDAVSPDLSSNNLYSYNFN